MAAARAPAETRPRETVFLLVCHDAPGSAAPREAHMHGHLAFIERHVDRILVAGPALDAANAIDASVFVVRAADEADAQGVAPGRSLLPEWRVGADRGAPLPRRLRQRDGRHHLGAGRPLNPETCACP